MIGGAAELPMAVYYIAASGSVSRVIEGRRPNGILVSPNGKYLYVAEPNDRELFRHDILAPGKVANGKLMFTGDPERDGSGPDGMAHDVHGNVYATYKGIIVLDPEGGVIGRIPMPEHPANCTFGGKDKKTLYITAGPSVYSLPMKVAGMALQPAGPQVPGSREPASPEEATAVAAEGPTREVTLEARGLQLTLQLPPSWKQEEVTSSMRLAQFVIPPVAGDKEPADLVLYYTGPGGMGPVQANLDRWVGQIDPKGRTAKIFTGKSKQGAYSLLDGRGTYLKPVGPPRLRKSKPMPGARMLAMIVETEKGPVYLKLTGPEKTVTGAADDLRKAVGADPAEEKELPKGD
jgi:gluconolactonase